jgi:hypothetical protein
MPVKHSTRVKRVGAWFIGVCSCGAATQTPRAKNVAEAWGRAHKSYWLRRGEA